MPTQTFTLPEPPQIPSGREVYDWIMGQIDPELTSGSIRTLKEKYKNETAAQKTARRKRYNAAFAKYDEMYEVYLADLHTRIRRYQREAMRSIEDFTREQEERRLNDMASSLFQLT